MEDESRRVGEGGAKALLTFCSLDPSLCQLFDYCGEVQFWIKDVDGRFQWVNREVLVNYSLQSPEQVIGKTDYDLSPAYLADQFWQDDQRVLLGEAIHGRIELVGRYDHCAKWCVTHKLPLRDAKGVICGTAGITRSLDAAALQFEVQDLAISQALEQIREDPRKHWSNQELARLVHLSVRTFERHFREIFQVSPQQYIRQLRVRLASHSLVYTTLTLAEIADRFGFADQSHFAREFQRHAQMTPGEYRKRYRVTK